MTEGIAKKYFPEKLDASSAGILPGKIDSRSTRTMRESTIDISEHKYKLMEAVDVSVLDFIITLDERARDERPFVAGDVAILLWAFDNPSKTKGNDDAVLQAFVMAMDGLHRRIAAIIATLP